MSQFNNFIILLIKLFLTYLFFEDEVISFEHHFSKTLGLY